MVMLWGRCAVLLAAVACVCADPLVIDRTKLGQTFDGIGGLSGGGATSRLLVDYVEPQRSEVLDYLFTPNFGASLQILKVEIGGDSQSTDGTESSHMHSEDDLDYQRGYEWWLMVEAKKRNPDIKLYGLSWAFPGWVGKGSGSPFTYPNLTSTYITNWIKGAKTVYGLDIDYIGVWNERASDGTYVKTLRAMLDSEGFGATQIVAQDGGTEICGAMAKDPEYAKAVSVIGLHYPSDFNDYTLCHSFGKPVWASEESSSYDDLNGAACWARVITSHWVLSSFTASIMWNLVGSYFHGTEWYASSMLTAVEPWSGHYDVMPVVWASAHVTQFTQIGWKYLKDGSGSGQLPKGGYYATFVDPSSGNFTINIVKIDHLHAACTRPGLPQFSVEDEVVTIALDPSMGPVAALAVWYSNFENYTSAAPIFQYVGTVAPGPQRTITLSVPVGSFYTLSTILQGPQKGSHGPTPASRPQFPLPYHDDFDRYTVSQEAAFFSDQIGAFEVHEDPQQQGNKVMAQMVPMLPIGWSDQGSRGPMTVVGMREWQDFTMQISFRVPSGLPPGVAGCVATRSDQMWSNGIVFCAYTATNAWTLSIGGPREKTGQPDNVVAQGQSPVPVTAGAWHTLTLTTIDTTAAFSIDGSVLSGAGVAVRGLDTGFAAFGTNGWYAVEYDNVSITPEGPRWRPADPCPAAQAGAALKVRDCIPNGLAVDSQAFDLDADYTLRHVASGLCAHADGSSGAAVTLVDCAQAGPLANLMFVNDYTRVRNTPVAFTLQANTALKLSGALASKAVTVERSVGAGAWGSWVYFPNTRQLRNQYVANTGLGYPQCLSTC